MAQDHSKSLHSGPKAQEDVYELYATRTHIRIRTHAHRRTLAHFQAPSHRSTRFVYDSQPSTTE